MTWRFINITLAILAALVCVYEAIGAVWWTAIAAGVCAVMFGLEAAGVRNRARSA